MKAIYCHALWMHFMENSCHCGVHAVLFARFHSGCLSVIQLASPCIVWWQLNRVKHTNTPKIVMECICMHLWRCDSFSTKYSFLCFTQPDERQRERKRETKWNDGILHVSPKRKRKKNTLLELASEFELNNKLML